MYVREQQDPAQMPLVDHDDMVQTLGANRADDPLDICILPGRVRCGDDLSDPHCRHALVKVETVRSVAISQQVAWRSIPRKGLCNLAGEPTGGGVPGAIQMQNLPPSVAEDDAHVQQPKRGGGDHKHIDSSDAVDLIAQEGPPGWRGGTMALDHMSADGCSADIDSQLEHLAVNPWRTP